MLISFFVFCFMSKVINYSERIRFAEKCVLYELKINTAYFFQKRREKCVVIYFKLNQIKCLVAEIERLEGLRNQIERSPDLEFKNKYYENLRWCKNELIILKERDWLQDLDLTEEEKRIARKYFYENFEWKDAMYHGLSERQRSKIYADESGSLETKALNTLKKRIYKTVQVFYDFCKKKEGG